MLGLGTTEIIAIVLVIFLLFGATRLPQLAKSLGQTRKAFKQGMREAEDEEQVQKQPQIDSSPITPEMSSLSDEEIMAEMRRRTVTKT